MSKTSLKYHLVDGGVDDGERYQLSSSYSSFSNHTLQALLALLTVSLLANAGLFFEKVTTASSISEPRSKYGAHL